MITRRNGAFQIWEKVRRADVHLREVYRLGSNYVYNHPYTGTQKNNPDTGEPYIEIIEVKPIPDDLSLAIGDFVHNLRSALDFLAFQIVSPKIPKRDWASISFPVAKRRSQFLDFFKPTKRRPNPPILAAGSDEVKLFKRLDAHESGKGSFYWLMHLLDIRDKHRLLVVAVGGHPGTYSAVQDGDIYWIESVIDQESPVILKPGNQIPLPALSGSSEDEEHFEFPPQIIFNEPEIFSDSADVIITLSAFMELTILTIGEFFGLDDLTFEVLTRQEGYVLPPGIFPL